MSKFMELHTDKKPFFINIHWIKTIQEDAVNGGTFVYMYNSGLIKIDESYDVVRKMIFGVY